MKIKINKIIFSIIIALLIVLQNPKAYFSYDLTNNLYRLRLIREWMSLKPSALPKDDVLNENIPDQWTIQSWGGATGFFRIDGSNPYEGEKCVYLQRTNEQGGMALIQIVRLPTSIQKLYVSIYTNGDGGVIQVWVGEKETGEWIKDAGWLDIPPTETWQRFTLSLNIHPNINLVRIWLRAVRIGIAMFDDVYVGTSANMEPETNLVNNPGFELDGLDIDPTIWWQSHVRTTTTTIKPHPNFSQNLSYVNIYDMLNGNIEQIKERAKSVGNDCVQTPEMTSWLLSKAKDFEQVGGLAAREQVYRLAIQLAPNCSQPYAALAQLYAQNHSNWMAAELYHQAASLAANSPDSGRYLFEEGFLRLRYTGELDLAAIAFQKAIRISGWEASSWHRGSALYYLGQTLESQGKPEEAIAIYQKVLECKDCTYYYDYARNRIASLTFELHPKDEP